MYVYAIIGYQNIQLSTLICNECMYVHTQFFILATIHISYMHTQLFTLSSYHTYHIHTYVLALATTLSSVGINIPSIVVARLFNSTSFKACIN